MSAFVMDTFLGACFFNIADKRESISTANIFTSYSASAKVREPFPGPISRNMSPCDGFIMAMSFLTHECSRKCWPRLFFATNGISFNLNSLFLGEDKGRGY